MAGAAIRSGAQIPIAELDVLWITAGLGCDGDTIAMTAATQPSIEDIVLGSLPWIPKIHFHNPFLAIENGDEFLRPFHAAAEGKLGPFILVVEGSIPNEHNKRKDTGRPGGRTPKPGSRSLPASGSTGWRLTPGRSSRRAPVRPTAEFMPWREIRPAAWAFPTIWDGNGNRRPGFPSCVFPDVRCSRTT